MVRLSRLADSSAASSSQSRDHSAARSTRSIWPVVGCRRWIVATRSSNRPVEIPSSRPSWPDAERMTRPRLTSCRAPPVPADTAGSCSSIMRGRVGQAALDLWLRPWRSQALLKHAAARMPQAVPQRGRGTSRRRGHRADFDNAAPFDDCADLPRAPAPARTVTTSTRTGDLACGPSHSSQHQAFAVTPSRQAAAIASIERSSFRKARSMSKPTPTHWRSQVQPPTPS